MNPSTARALARHAKVQHLSNHAAATILGLRVGYVARFRHDHPEIATHSLATGASLANPGEGGAKGVSLSSGLQKRVMEYEAPNTRTNRVSLRLEPPCITRGAQT